MANQESTVKGAVSFIKSQLNNFYPEREISCFTNVIFEFLLNYTKTDIHLNYNTKLSEAELLRIDDIVAQLKEYRPVQYITGETEFYGYKLKVKEGILIPRPETEELVKWILEETANSNLNILDIGTGSGCIAIALAGKLPDATVRAFDISEETMVTARENGKINGVKVFFYRDNIFAPEHSGNIKYDIIVSNPPYVTEAEKSSMDKNVLNYEPHEALFVPDNNPLKYYTAIVDFSKFQLNKGSHLYFEVNENKCDEVCSLLRDSGYSHVEWRKDINGKPRMVRGSYK